MKKLCCCIGFLIALISTASHSEEKVLKSGLRVVFSKSRSPITTAVVLIKVGEADAPPFLATMTNRMLLRGTAIRNSQQMYQELEVMGGKIGSTTLFSFSSVYVQAPSEHFPECFNILCECVARATFDSSEITRVTAVSGEENKPSSMFFTRDAFYTDAPLRQKLFAGSELGRDLTGKSEFYAKKQILDFYHSWYCPENMVVAVSGRFDKNAVLKTLNGYWKASRKTMQNKTHLFSRGRADTTETILTHDRPKDWVWIGFTAPPFLGGAFDEILLLEMSLANGSAAYFPKHVFPDKSNDIDIQSYYQSEPSLGYFAFSIRTPPGKAESVKNQILAELDKIKKQGLPETYFEIGKRRMASRIAILSQYSIYNAMFTALAAAGEKAYMPFPDFEKRIGLLTLPQVNQAAKALFVHPSVVIFD